MTYAAYATDVDAYIAYTEGWMTEEMNTRVSLRDHMDTKFEAQKRYSTAQFAALKQEISASNDALEQKIDASSKVLKQDIDARSKLEQEKWNAHDNVHKKERGVVATVGTLAAAFLAWFGGRFPK